MNLLVRSRIPGKVMIAGEYDVLRGGQAISATVNQWFTVESYVASPKDLTCTVKSDLWPQPKLLDFRDFSNSQTQVPEIPQHAVRDILLQSIIASSQHLLPQTHWQDKQRQLPFREVRVHSEFPPVWGLGSSSALRLGVCRNALYFSHYAAQAQNDCHETSLKTVHQAVIGSMKRAHQEAWHQQLACQKHASGYDIATQAQGGVCLYKMPTTSLDEQDWPTSTTSQLPESSVAHFNHHICLLVGGKGAPTRHTMTSTSHWLDSDHNWQTLHDLSASLIEHLLEYCTTGSGIHHQKVVQAIAAHSRFFANSPNFPTGIMNSFFKLPGFGRDWAIKTTGAGGEDALLFFGDRKWLSPIMEIAEQRNWRCLQEVLQPRGAVTELAHSEVTS